MSMEMVGIDCRMSEVVGAICCMRSSGSVASRDVVGDAIAKVTNSRNAIMTTEDDMAQQFV